MSDRALTGGRRGGGFCCLKYIKNIIIREMYHCRETSFSRQKFMTPPPPPTKMHPKNSPFQCKEEAEILMNRCMTYTLLKK